MKWQSKYIGQLLPNRWRVLGSGNIQRGNESESYNTDRTGRRPNDLLPLHLLPAVTVLTQTHVLPVHTNIRGNTLSSELFDIGQAAIKVKGKRST